jgi:hypothetical protein
VGQGQLAAAGDLGEVQAHPGVFRVVLGHGEGEDDPPRAVDHLVFADVLDVAHVRPPVGEVEAAADLGVDLGPDHLPIRGREGESPGGLRVQPGVEHPLRRVGVAVGHDDLSHP